MGGGILWSISDEQWWRYWGMHGGISNMELASLSLALPKSNNGSVNFSRHIFQVKQKDSMINWPITNEQGCHSSIHCLEQFSYIHFKVFELLNICYWRNFYTVIAGRLLEASKICIKCCNFFLLIFHKKTKNFKVHITLIRGPTTLEGLFSMPN